MKTTYVIKHWDGRWKYYCNGGGWRVNPKLARQFDTDEEARQTGQLIDLSFRIVTYQTTMEQQEKRHA